MTVPTSSTRPEADDARSAGVRIDLELADMRAVAEGEARRIVDGRVLQARLERFERKVVRRHRPPARPPRRRRAGRCRRRRKRRRRNRCRPRAASSRWAAISLPLATILSAARSSAEPPTAMEREPKVPVPCGTTSVSPSTTSILLDRHAEPRRTGSAQRSWHGPGRDCGCRAWRAPRRPARRGWRRPRRSRRGRPSCRQSARARRPRIRRSRPCRCRASGRAARPRARRLAKPS